MDSGLATLANLCIPDTNCGPHSAEVVRTAIAALTRHADLPPIVEKAVATVNNLTTHAEAGRWEVVGALLSKASGVNGGSLVQEPHRDTGYPLRF